ncbi:hypothetical protein HF086_004173 [Spodoptera exigua]|uniref:Uncharacterized protein n=1 Tax=Spodoptera exigua TaxID=7107 RepID=A0A922SHX9_SPOEX|nr:hypothetical protein HF086_004173 [Spodoptera exigua]
MYFSFSMDYIKILLVISAFISLNDAVKVNMQGSLSFGKEVVDTLSHYMRRNAGNVVARRRSIPFSKETDVIYIIIKSAYLCRDLDFCEGKLEQFLNEYIMVQTKSIEAIFEGIVNPNQLLDQDAKTEQRLVFEEDLKKCLREIRRVLRQANMKMRDESITYLWIEVIKKISVMFQTAAILFAAERLEGKPDEIMEVKKKLTQKLVIATTIVEGKYESKLCSEYDICIKAYEVTKALNTLLGALRDMEEENVKIFIRYVSEALLETNLYSHLSEVTSNELQIILNDMAYSENVSAKTVLLSIQKAVEDRLNALHLKTHMVNGRDVELVHVILSDMDHVYGKSSIDPFHVFMSSFFTWERTKSRLSGPIRSLLKELKNEINGLPDDLGFKLINEVRAFLEITVDPEN